MKPHTILIALCAVGALNARAQPVSPYDPRIDGSWTTYAIYEVGGYWNYQTRELELAWKRPTGRVQTIWWRITTTAAYGNTPLLGEFIYDGDASVLSNPAAAPGEIIYDVVGTPSGGNYPFIGEVGNPPVGIIGTPGEPKLPLNPHPHDCLQMTHQYADSSSGKTVYGSIDTFFVVVAGPGKVWGQWSDCVETSLEERPGDSDRDWVYNYVWARGIGLVDLWYGNLRRGQTGWYFNGQATSWEYISIASGQLPVSGPLPTLAK